jgi:hypothetical protein
MLAWAPTSRCPRQQVEQGAPPVWVAGWNPPVLGRRAQDGRWHQCGTTHSDANGTRSTSQRPQGVGW